MKSIKENTNIKFGIILSYASIFISLIANIFLQRFINQPGHELISTQYNLYSFSSSISSLLIILTLGLTSGYIRFATRSEKENGAAGLRKTNSVYAILLSISAIAALLIGTLISVFFITGVIPLKNYSDGDRQLITIFLLLGSINVAVGFIASVFTIFLNYRSKFIVVRLLTLIFSTASPLISLPFIHYFNNLIAFSAVHVVLTSISLIIQIIYSIGLLKYRMTLKLEKGTSKYFKEVLAFTLFVFLVEIFIQVDANADKILLGFFAPPGSEGADASAVGSYNIGFSIVSVIGTSCGAVFSAYAPKINRAVVNQNKEKVVSVFNRTTEIALLVYFFIFGGFITCGQQFVYAWLGDKRFYVYYIVLTLLIINIIPYTINITSEIQRAYNKHQFRSFVMLGMAAFNIAFTLLALFLVKTYAGESSENYLYYQLAAVMSVTLFSSLVFNGIVMGIYNKKVIGLPIGFYFKKLFTYAILTAVPVAITLLIYHFIDLSQLNYWISTIIIGVTFVVLFALMIVAFNRRFLKTLIRLKKKNKPIELSAEDLQILKKIELDIFRDVIRVCDILKIDYYCVGGTALGAVKYKGFIPWDDDIDIAMKRSDFDTFISEAPKYLKEYYFVQSFENDKKYLSTMIKVRDSRTTFDEISTSNLGIKGGVFLDIFPIDNTFDSKAKIIKNKYNYALLDASTDKSVYYSTIKSMVIDFISIFDFRTKERIMRDCVDLLKNNKDSNTVYCRIANYDKSIFDNYTIMKFEGIDVKVPKEINKYLEQAYGDISKDPEKDKQIAHHFVYSFDVESIRSLYENSDN